MDAFCFLFLWSHMKSSLAENPIANLKNENEPAPQVEQLTYAVKKGPEKI